MPDFNLNKKIIKTIFVKNKIDDEDVIMDTEFELVHEFYNPAIYELYYTIAKSRNILDLDEEYF